MQGPPMHTIHPWPSRMALTVKVPPNLSFGPFSLFNEGVHPWPRLMALMMVPLFIL